MNEKYQTSVPHIYAVGDVIGFPALAATSMDQGRLAASHAFDEPVRDLQALQPIGIYTIPEISYCGKTEGELTREAVPFEVGISRYRELARGQIIGDSYGMLKLIVHADTREILGVHIFGTNATELVHIGQAIMGCGGTVDYLVDTVLNYPTLSEAYKVAALDVANKLRAVARLTSQMAAAEAEPRLTAPPASFGRAGASVSCEADGMAKMRVYHPAPELAAATARLDPARRLGARPGVGTRRPRAGCSGRSAARTRGRGSTAGRRAGRHPGLLRAGRPRHRRRPGRGAARHLPRPGARGRRGGRDRRARLDVAPGPSGSTSSPPWPSTWSSPRSARSAGSTAPPDPTVRGGA